MRATIAASRAQRFHPVRRARDRSGDAPAHNQQRNQHDQNDVRQRAQERLAPDAQHLSPDISRVMNNRQTADQFVSPM